MPCGCPKKGPSTQPGMSIGTYGKLNAFPAMAPDPRTGSVESREGYFGSNASPLTLSRQATPAVPMPPFNGQQGNVAPIGGIHASSVDVARSGLCLQIGTVFRRAVQYIMPWVPTPQPMYHSSYLTVGQMNPPDRALELPRYSFAAVDSEALLDQAKSQAKRAVQSGAPSR